METFTLVPSTNWVVNEVLLFLNEGSEVYVFIVTKLNTTSKQPCYS